MKLFSASLRPHPQFYLLGLSLKHVIPVLDWGAGRPLLTFQPGRPSFSPVWEPNRNLISFSFSHLFNLQKSLPSHPHFPPG